MGLDQFFPLSQTVVTPPAAPQKKKLKEYHFNDLFLCATPKPTAMFHFDNAHKNPLQAPPLELTEDLSIFCQYVLQSAQSRGDQFHVDYDNLRYRVTRQVGTTREWFAIRKPLPIVPQMNHLTGFPAELTRKLFEMGHRARENKGGGMILLSGPSGNGKTTSAYALFNSILHQYGSIGVTVENPPEMMLEGPVGQSGFCFQVPVANDQEMARGIESALRWSPKYILLGEIRRASEAAEAVRVAKSGHLVITTTHGGNIIETIERMGDLISVEMPRRQLASALSCVIQQRLSDVPSGGKRLFVNPLVIEPGKEGQSIRNLIFEGELPKLNTDIAAQEKKYGAHQMVGVKR
ncbi:ATPase, T2SS/T4P/T4SS family [Pseudovibrio ascidiaceicola]|uniref:ATPase, T2SS/T4P/T4SS family n=1 Tax=Pseudovibrio ascidiaceicola TaxID=285279 RepID=UPI003D35DC14